MSKFIPFSGQAFKRRGFLQVGSLTGLGLSMGDFFRLNARADQKTYASVEGKAKSVIHIFLPGGMAHQESFDPKPLAPSEYRGPYGAINTKVDGLQFGELWKNMAGVADKITVCRSMTHGEAAHERGTHNMFTGYRPSPALQYPSIGSVISHEYGTRKNLPPYVCIPGVPNEYAGSGYLSTAYGPFSLGSDPAEGGFKVQDLALPGGITEGRFNRRRSILSAVDEHFKTVEKSDQINAMDTFYQDAYKLIASPEARAAFDIGAEKNEIRDAYGRNTAGQRLLMARRLVESGVRFVSVTYGGWDHHDNIRDQMAGQTPSIDQALAYLIRDLEQRGLLDSTMVMVSSEFGRTPKINNTGGRDHWPKVFSVMLAGGGVKKGFVYGSSDALGAEPENDPLTVEDLACTVYHQIGVNSDKELMAPGARPIEIVDGGKVIHELLA
jgi:hypothetical protein